MPNFRFEIGECLDYVEKRFPNGHRHTELRVIGRLLGNGEPQYQLFNPADLAQCVLAESQLRPSDRGADHGSRAALGRAPQNGRSTE